MKTISKAAIAAIMATSAHAQSSRISGAYAGCITEDGLKEFVEAAVNDDIRQINALLDGGGCYNIDGREFSIVDRGISRSKIRVYAGGESFILWTVTSAIMPD